ncbi:hypothetical protein TNCV_1031971 [Trichonephila clavipes]|nr:hypothetical protein TNCV_1031971 [Trichonephila clavipes]
MVKWWTTPGAGTCPNYLTTPTGEGVSTLTDLTCIAALHGGSLVELPRTHDMPIMIRNLDHWATAAR